MNFLWPGSLILLALIPLIVAGYFWILRRRSRFAVRYSSLSLVRAALPRQSGLRRHLPFFLFLLAISSLTVAFSRPVATVEIPTGQTTIILAMDVSLSMCSTDIQPNRLKAAETAALSFVQSQPRSVQIGVVAFAGFAALVQPPTTNQDAVSAAIESLTLGRRTAIGSGILKSIDTIAEVDDSIPPSFSEFTTGVEPTPVPEGFHAPNIIVLLTDGVSNAGPQPLDAAQQAADRGIRVYTIGFGTATGSMMDCGWQLQGGNMFGGIGGSGGGYRRGIDEVTLMQVAELTGGEYFTATSANELIDVFHSLPLNITTRLETTEISAFFSIIGALLATIAIGLALLWNKVF